MPAMKRLLVIVALLAAMARAQAQGPDDQYVSIYTLIQQADALSASRDAGPALAKYLEAQTALQKFQKGYPDWNVNVINFRLNYLADKVAVMSAKAPTPAAPVSAAATNPAAGPIAGPAQAAKGAPGEWENQLAASQDQARRLQADKILLEAKLKEALSAQPATKDPRELAKAEEKIKALQKENDLLRVTLVQEKSKQTTVAATTTLPASSKSDEASRVKQLERQRDELQKKLEAAAKEPPGRKGNEATARIQEMENQVATLHARLEVFEARQVPYTTEELALFKRPEPKLAELEPNAGKKSVKELPAGTAALVAEAERYFSARQLDKAEEKYLEVVSQDDKNAATLANLAAIQLERNRLDQAEKHVQQALALAPLDAFSLSILGQLKFRQEKYDEALDALSRAAKLDPQSAQVQNYLGITLSQKGLRGQAETALRKAIQLEPRYGDAHHNLAVIYLAQQPPLVELARWHYQKALAAGSPHNASLEKMFDAKKPAGGAQ